jgi:glutamate-1-semialdehyde 2,1-aminomutase
MSANQSWQERALRRLPGGVNSPVRAFRSVGGVPRFVVEARGAQLVDVEGRRYVDWVGSWGAAILGHAHPAVVAAIAATAARGTSSGVPGPLEVELAERLAERFPSLEKLRFVNSGTEAVMSALRVARAATGREGVLKFEGCYHGHADPLLVKAGSGAESLGIPDSAGVPRGIASTTRVAPYNDLAAVERVFAESGEELAAVLVEPIAANMGVVPPAPGFLAGLRRLCDRHGTVLIFDEVITGCRVARGGAQELLGVRPDLTTLGKAIGGGLPVGAFGGRAELMDLLAPLGPVYQAGTMSGNPLTMAAGLATLELLDAAAYRQLEATGAALEAGLRQRLTAHGVTAAVQRAGSLLTVFFGVERVHDLTTARQADGTAFARFFHALLAAGVHLPPSGFEAWFLSLAHGEPELAATFAAVDAALAALAPALTV